MQHKDNLRFARAVEQQQAGALAEAEEIYRDLLKRTPKHVEAAVNLAIILRDSRRAEEALRLLKRARRRRPESPEIDNEYALALLKLQRFDEAEAILCDILARDPDSYTARSNLGAGLMQAARYREAVEPFAEAVVRHPDRARAHDQLGGAWFALGRMGDAEACYRHALDCAPSFAPAWNHLGDLYRVEGDFAASDACYRKAVEISPGYGMAAWNRAMGLLSAGDFAAGWPAYEARFAAGIALREPCGLPKWRGAPVAGRRVLVFAEQGVGGRDHVRPVSAASRGDGRSDHLCLRAAPRSAVRALLPGFRRAWLAARWRQGGNPRGGSGYVASGWRLAGLAMGFCPWPRCAARWLPRGGPGENRNVARATPPLGRD